VFSTLSHTYLDSARWAEVNMERDRRFALLSNTKLVLADAQTHRPNTCCRNSVSSLRSGACGRARIHIISAAACCQSALPTGLPPSEANSCKLFQMPPMSTERNKKKKRRNHNQCSQSQALTVLDAKLFTNYYPPFDLAR